MISPIKSNQLITASANTQEVTTSKQRNIQEAIINDYNLPLALNSEYHFDKISKPTSTSELLISLTDTIEDLKSSILKFEIQHQRNLIDNILSLQKKSFELIKNKTKTYQDLAKWNVFENIFKSILATASIIGGVSLFSTNPLIGGFLISSGAASISSVSLELAGFNEASKKLSYASLTIGFIGIGIGSYTSPELIKQGSLKALEASKAILSGLSGFASNYAERASSVIEIDLTEQNKQQSLINNSHEETLRTITNAARDLNVSKEASRMLNQIEELKYQYLNSIQQQG